jgi:hypothetical protein
MTVAAPTFSINNDHSNIMCPPCITEILLDNSKVGNPASMLLLSLLQSLSAASFPQSSCSGINIQLNGK